MSRCRACSCSLARVSGAGALYRARVDVYTDSTASTGALRRGARVVPMRGDGVRLVEWGLAHRATVAPHWLPREALAAEDAASRRVRWGDARLTDAARRTVFAWAWYGQPPSLDAFASAATAVAPRWLSMSRSRARPASTGSRPRGPGLVWAFPPVALARRARLRAARLCATDAAVRSVVVVGPRVDVEVGADAVLPLPAACCVLPPDFAAAAIPPTPLVAALFRSRLGPRVV